MSAAARCLPETRTGDRADPLAPGRLCLALEAGTDFIIATGDGMWTPAQMEEHMRRYRELLLRVRRPGRGARVIVNLKDVGIQSPEVTAVLQRHARQSQREGDRIAMIVPSSLAKMQMRRVLGTRVHEYFVSENAARAWLSGGN